jgi:hypothetical protein
MRSGLWTHTAEADKIPTAGQFLQEMEADFDGGAYDSTYQEYAKTRMW